MPNHFPVVGEALLWTLEQGLGEAWTPEVKTAWTHTWQDVVKVMLPALLKAKAAGSRAGVLSPAGSAKLASRQAHEEAAGSKEVGERARKEEHQR